MDVSREHFPGMGFPQNGSGEMCRGIRTPQFSSSCKRRHTWERWWRPCQGIHGDHTRPWSEKEGEMRSMERLRNSSDCTRRHRSLCCYTAPLLRQAEGPLWGSSLGSQHLAWANRTNNSTNNTGHRFQHIAHLRPPSPARSKDWQQRTPWRLHWAQGKVGERRHRAWRNSWVTPNHLRHLTCILKATGNAYSFANGLFKCIFALAEKSPFRSRLKVEELLHK